MDDGVDLDALAAGYRHRRASAVALGRAVMAADDAGLGPGSVALDVGGGRGDHAAVFAARGALSVVVDPGPAMTAAAASQPGVAAVRGASAALPIRDGAAGLVYFHLSLHYGDWRAALAEGARVCAPGGSLWAWTLDPARFADSFLTRWFPSVPEIDEPRFPPVDGIAGALGAAGWEDVVTMEAPERVVRTAGEWRAGVEAGFVSTLQLLPPGEVAAGLERFDRAHPDPAREVRYDMAYVAVRARRASLA
ncbi:MAG: class I SAM-dependent methyltransferase [Actinobacteria bacterium]|nr:class I SAM-dependent methyltransferase [Actinomycetota bacterium]